MIKKSRELNFAIFLLVFIILIGLANSEVYMGTSEGYIFNTENQNVSDAKVVVTVNRCSVGCSRETSSESSGYYMTANLNLPKLDLLSVYAEKETALGLEFGTATGSSNEFQAAEIDVKICLPPPEPFLINKSSTHKTSETFEWISYADKKNYQVYDEFQFDSNSSVKSNNYGKKSTSVDGLSFSSHIWRVRTCNNFCCSSWVYSSINVGNSAPSPPVIKNQSDTAILGKKTFEWISGADPDGDSTYDEFKFGILNMETEKVSPATSPIIRSVLGCHFYQWGVRTCEKTISGLCSLWSEGGFFACGMQCPVCTLVAGTGNCQSAIETVVIENRTTNIESYLTNTFYSLFVNSPQSVVIGEEFYLKVSFSTTVDASDIIFKVVSPYFEVNDFVIGEVKSMNAKFNMTGRAKQVKPGLYPMNLEVYLKGVKIISEPVYIEIKEGKILIPYDKFPWILLIILLIILIFFSYKYLRKKYSETS